MITKQLSFFACMCAFLLPVPLLDSIAILAFPLVYMVCGKRLFIYYIGISFIMNLQYIITATIRVYYMLPTLTKMIKVDMSITHPESSKQVIMQTIGNNTAISKPIISYMQSPNPIETLALLLMLCISSYISYYMIKQVIKQIRVYYTILIRVRKIAQTYHN